MIQNTKEVQKKDPTSSGLIKLAHDQSVTFAKHTLKQLSQISEVAESTSAVADGVDIYSSLFFFKKVNQVRSNTSKFYETMMYKTGTFRDGVKYGLGALNAGGSLCKTGLKVVTISIKRELIPSLSKVKFIGKISLPLSILLTGMGVISSSLTLHDLIEVYRELPNVNFDNLTEEEMLLVETFLNHNIFPKTDIKKEEIKEYCLKDKIQRKVIQKERHLLEATDEKVVHTIKTLFKEGDYDLVKEGDSHHFQRTDHSMIKKALKNAKILVMRKITVQGFNITVGVISLIALGILFTGVINPLIPFIFLMLALAIETGIGLYQLFGLKKGLEPLEDCV